MRELGSEWGKEDKIYRRFEGRIGMILLPILYSTTTIPLLLTTGLFGHVTECPVFSFGSLFVLNTATNFKDRGKLARGHKRSL